MKAYRGDRGIAPFIISLHIEVVLNVTPRPLYPQEKDPNTHWIEVERALQPVWAILEKRKYLAPAGIRVPDRPARRHSLYRLHYPGSWSGEGATFT